MIVDDDGNVKTVCIYGAPDAGTVQRHADALGRHRVESIVEIAGDVTPGDFPLS